MSTISKWAKRYMALAHHVAQWSRDPTTKVGAVAVGVNQRQIAVGYNGFPTGIADTEERLNDRETKLLLMQHAERNVLDQATFNLEGALLVVTHHPCAECAKSIVSKNIRLVLCPVGSAGYRMRWKEEIELAKMILNEGGVVLREVTEDGETIEDAPTVSGKQMDPANDST
jgi:dCMP deaminase